MSTFPSFAYDFQWLVAAAITVVLCSIPTGLIITKVFLGYDVREQGSKNIGMTNVMRTGGKWPGIFTFAGDVLKGTASVFIYLWMDDDATVWGEATIALLAVLAHTRSIFLKFKGGKGVATYFGVWLAMDWRVALIGMAVWMLFYKATAVSSIGSLAAMVILTATVFWLRAPTAYMVLAPVLMIYVGILHKGNIVRLINGKELAMKKNKPP